MGKEGSFKAGTFWLIFPPNAGDGGKGLEEPCLQQHKGLFVCFCFVFKAESVQGNIIYWGLPRALQEAGEAGHWEPRGREG